MVSYYRAPKPAEENAARELEDDAGGREVQVVVAEVGGDEVLGGRSEMVRCMRCMRCRRGSGMDLECTCTWSW